MRSIILVAGAALAVSACGNNTESTDANVLDANTLVVDDGALTNGDLNALGTENGTIDANTANAIEQDLNTNDPDTNLANGL